MKKMFYIEVGLWYLAICCEALCAGDEFVCLPYVVKVLFLIPGHQYMVLAGIEPGTTVLHASGCTRSGPSIFI